MTYPATLTLPDSTALNFLIAQIGPSGWPMDQIANVPEPLVTAGTDGKRLRVRRREFRQFTMTTWLDVDTYTNAVAAGRNYLRAVGLPCTLSWAAADLSATWNKVLVDNCQPTVAIGKLTGAGATDGSTAIIRATWTMTAQALAGASP